MSNVAYADFGAYRVPQERRVAQLEDGFMRLANDLLDATMCSGLPETELCIVMAVWRKTYGYSKKVDWISNEQFESMIGKHYTHCSTAKNNLVRKKVLIQMGRKVGMNTNISEWETKNNGFRKTLAEPAKESLAEPANSVKQNLLTTKDNITKDKKENKNTMPEQVQAKQEKSSGRYEETDKAFGEIFWGAGMVKTGKQKALSAFRKQFTEWRKVTKGSPEQFATMLAEDIRQRAGVQFGFDKMHPATYLNGQRWEDESPVHSTQDSSVKPAVSVSQSGYVYFDR